MVRTTAKITVVTVVLNAENRIRKTIDSVLSQDYADIEYIIKDGGSTDGTLEIIRDAAAMYPQIKYISAPDGGIYCAMNDSLRLVTGGYVNFLNAGDYYASEDVISRVAAAAETSRALALYGDVIYINADGSTDLRKYGAACSDRLYYLTGDCINHQALFAATKLLRRASFDTSYRICADREWMMRVGLYRGKMRMKSLGFPVVYYSLDGISAVNKDGYREEADRCIRQHMSSGHPVFAVFEFFRSSAILGRLLHRIYRRIFIG